MLIYHPAFDAYHCAFRLLAILHFHKELEMEKVQILDFYLAFPSALSNIRWPREAGISRKELKALANPYRDPLSNKSTFRGMQQVQTAAARCVAASELIVAELLELGIVRRTTVSLMEGVADQLNAYIERDAEAVELVLVHLAGLPLLGRDGLKARTGLLEHRYDSY